VVLPCAREAVADAFVACAVNEDMGQCGGVIVGREGKCIDEVRDYKPDYVRGEHGRAIRPLLTLWRRVIRRGRRWPVTVSKPWKLAAYDADATFNDEGFFYFRTEAEARVFAKRYRGKLVPSGTRRAR